MMDDTGVSLVRLIMAFTLVLGLMAAMGFILKYFAARGITMPTKNARMKRLKIVESLMVDGRRRLVIVNCDGREHLLLLTANNDIVIESNLPPASTPNAP